MHAARRSTYPPVLEGIRSITMARDTLTVLAPMDVSVVCKGKGLDNGKEGEGKKGKGNNKEKEKDSSTNPGTEMICHCHRKGHRKLDCGTFEKDKDKKGVTAVQQAPALTRGAAAAPSVTPSRVSMIELGYAFEVLMSNHSRRATLRTASGAQIEHAAQKTFEYKKGDGGPANVNFEVVGVTRPLVAVGELQKRRMNGDGPTWKLRDSRPNVEAAPQQYGFGAFQWRLNDASDMWKERHEYCGSCRLGRLRAYIERPESAPVSRGYTIDVAWEDAEANVLTAVPTLKRTWGCCAIKARIDACAIQELVLQLCRMSWVG